MEWIAIKVKKSNKSLLKFEMDLKKYLKTKKFQRTIYIYIY